MNDEEIYEKLLKKEIAVSFSSIEAFRIFCAFLSTKGIYKKNPSEYYWRKYEGGVCVTITDEFKFKCGSAGFYQKTKQIYKYDKKPYIVELLDLPLL